MKTPDDFVAIATLAPSIALYTPPAPHAHKGRVTKAPNLIQRSQGGNYSFRTARRINGRKKEFWISTGTNILAVAKAEAVKLLKQFAEAQRTERWDKVGLLKLRSDLPTFEELQKSFNESIDRESVRAPGAEARRSYWRCMLRLLAWAIAGREPSKEEIAAAGQLTIGTLAGHAGEDVVKSFRAAWLSAAAPGDVHAEASRRRSGDSMLRQARSCLGQEAMRCYKAWTMPNVDGFMKGPGFDAKRPQHAEIGTGLIAAITKAAEDELKEQNPRVYLIHLCHKFLGLRNNEIQEARVGWFRKVRVTPERPWQCVCEISERNVVKPPKHCSYGQVPLKAEVMAEFAATLRKLGVALEDAAAFIVPARTPTERVELVNIEHAGFMRRFLPADQFAKAGYELRRWAQQKMEQRYSREAGAAFTRHAAPRDANVNYRSAFYSWQKEGDDVGVSLADARGAVAGGATAETGSAWD